MGEDLISKIQSVLYAGGLGIMGGIAKLLFNLATGRKTYTFRAFFINICLAFFAGRIAGEFLPMEIAYRDGFIGLSGVMAYEIMYMIEVVFSKVLIKKVNKTLGVNLSQDDLAKKKKNDIQ